MHFISKGFFSALISLILSQLNFFAMLRDMHASVVIFWFVLFLWNSQNWYNKFGWEKKAHGCLAANEYEYGMWMGYEYEMRMCVCGFLYVTWHAVVQHFRGHVHYWRLSENQVSLLIPCPAHYCSSLRMKWEKKEYDIINKMQWKQQQQKYNNDSDTICSYRITQVHEKFVNTEINACPLLYEYAVCFFHLWNEINTIDNDRTMRDWTYRWECGIELQSNLGRDNRIRHHSFLDDCLFCELSFPRSDCSCNCCSSE